MGSVVSGVFLTLLKKLLATALKLFAFVAVILILYLLFFFIRYRVSLFSSESAFAALKIKHKLYDIFRWLLVDFKRARVRSYKPFEEFGFTVFVGRQGAGKTVSMVHYLSEMKRIYPGVKIVTNFACSLADYKMNDWRDFFEIRNSDKGVIFAIDEIHSEYDSSKWKDFPESLLSEISQQRKQRIKIVATSQCFKRIVKPMREQTFSVVECRTFFKRWTFCKEYDAFEYDCLESSYAVNSPIKPLASYSFIQSDELRSCYDTYEKIERLEKTDFLSRSERGSNNAVNIRFNTR